MNLKKFAKNVEVHLGLDPIKIVFEDMEDDSRLYTENLHVAINSKYKDNYVECAKCIAHEFRHIFQFVYVRLMQDDRAKRWLEEMSKAKNSSNMACYEEYLCQELEVDACAFAKYYLEKFEGIKVEHKVPIYERLICAYIEKYKGTL